MIVRFDKEALAQSQATPTRSDTEAESNNGTAAKVSEVDKIISDTKQKIAEGKTPAVGVSASNSGRGYDAVPAQEEGFVPTSLSDALVEEPIAIEEDDSPELAATENPTEAAATAATSAAQESTSAAQESKPESKEPADA